MARVRSPEVTRPRANYLTPALYPLDAIRLRKEHHIVGNLVGALPEYPRQHDDYGLPLVLLPEEARLLAQLSLITLVDVSDEGTLAEDYFASETCQTFYQQLLVRQHEEINERFKQTRKDDIEANLDKIVQGKAKKCKLAMEPTGPDWATFRESVRAQLLSAIKDVPNDPSTLLTRFYTESPYPNAPERPFSLPALRPHSLEALRYAVFEHFWQRGYYLTEGVKFGAHFLAYDNDPMAFHAKFIIMCCPDSASMVHFENSLLQAYGRLGKNVRKNVIVAHYDHNSALDSSAEMPIIYKHIQWNNTGLP